MLREAISGQRPSTRRTLASSSFSRRAENLDSRWAATSSISGTVGWEAVRKGKPALVFGPTWYADFPGVQRWREGLRFEDIVGQPPEHARLEQAVGQFLHQGHEGIVERHYKTLVPDFDEGRNTASVGQAVADLLRGRVATTFA